MDNIPRYCAFCSSSASSFFGHADCRGVVEWILWQCTNDGKVMSAGSEHDCPPVMPRQGRESPWKTREKLLRLGIIEFGKKASQSILYRPAT